MRRLRQFLLVFTAALSLGCTEGCAKKDPVSASATVHQKPAGAGSGEQGPRAATPTAGSYAAEVRARNYPAAARLLDELPGSEQRAPEVLYVRARVALELGEHENALRLARELEETTPNFANEARDVTVEVAKSSGDVTLAEALIGSSARAKKTTTALEQRLALAMVHRASSSLDTALALTETILRDLPKKGAASEASLDLEGRTRKVRAEIYVNLENDEAAAREFRWLASHGKLLSVSEDADDRAEQLCPSRPLTADQRLDRARAFAKQGWVERTERELTRLQAAPGKRPVAGEEDDLLAQAYFTARSDDLRAAALFRSAAKVGGPERKRRLYYEARALLRAGDAPGALTRFSELAELGGSHGESARFQAARIHYVGGEFRTAIAAYEDYLRRYQKGQHAEDARSELAVALLAHGDFGRARKALAERVKGVSDGLERARLLELEAVALLGAGDESGAATLLERTIELRPLSLPALFAAARLESIGRPPRTQLAPAPSTALEPPLFVELPDKAWRLSRVGLDEEAETMLRAAEPEIQRRYGTRSGEALCRLYGQLAMARRRYQVAQTAVSEVSLMHEPTSRTTWQWECIYPEPYEDLVRGAAARHRVAPELVYAVMRQESAFRPQVVSPAGAVGLMQLIPPTAQRVAEELREPYSAPAMSTPVVNIEYGAYYLRRLLDLFREHPALTVAAYNAGPSAVSSWLAGGQKLPLDVFVARIPFTETRNYVVRVLGNHARYAYIAGQAGPTLSLDLPAGVVVSDDAY